MKPTRIAGAVALTVAALTALTGCFMVPVLDGRSPFDKPFGVRSGQLRAAVPQLQAALDTVDSGPDWSLIARGTASNCEGDCDLRLLVEFLPADSLLADEAARILAEEADDAEDDPFSELAPPSTERRSVDLSIPDELWLAAANAALPAAEGVRIDVSLISRSPGDLILQKQTFTAQSNTCAPAWGHLGDSATPPGSPEAEKLYTIRGERSDSHCITRFHTGKNRGLAETLGLS